MSPMANSVPDSVMPSALLAALSAGLAAGLIDLAVGAALVPGDAPWLEELAGGCITLLATSVATALAVLVFSGVLARWTRSPQASVVAAFAVGFALWPLLPLVARLLGAIPQVAPLDRGVLLVAALAFTAWLALRTCDADRLTRRTLPALLLTLPVGAAVLTAVSLAASASDSLRGSIGLAAAFTAAAVVAALVWRVARGAERLGVARWIVPAWVLALGVGAVAVDQRKPEAELPPAHSGALPPGAPRHVVLIVVDTLRASAIGAFGGPAGATPNIDALAADSHAFHAARSASPWTLPSMVSLMTGESPETHRVLREDIRVPRKLPTLAEQLSRAGYATAAFVRNMVLLPHSGMHRGFHEYYVNTPLARPASVGARLLSALLGPAGERMESDAELAQRTSQWLELRAKDPFFVWLQLYDPHIPYAPPREFLGGKQPPARMDASFEQADQVREGVLRLEPPQREWVRSLYDAEVRASDAAVGRVLDRLRALGLYDDALIVFTSDHGEEFFEHGLIEHGHALYDEVLRVPLLVKLPRQSARVDVRHNVANWEIAPWLLARCGLAAADAGAGLLDETRRDPPGIVRGMLFYGERSAVLFERWKYVVHHDDGREELYDLERDPAERTPLQDEAALEQGRALLARLRAEAEQRRGELGLEGDERAGLSSDLTRGLQELGYVK